MSSEENELELEIGKHSKDISTDSYSMSIGELISLYKDDEINIHPEFQRFFRWNDEQKTRLIESIILGIPIPPIFVYQNSNGTWEIIDGLQRLSTIYEFVGILKNSDNKTRKALKLTSGARYLTLLEDKVWEDETTPSRALTHTQRLYIKRAKLGIHIILKGSDFKAKYELFQRLNNGGTPLGFQETLNCIMVMLNNDFFIWLEKQVKNTDFQDTVASLLTERAIAERYDLELALRFFIFRRVTKDVKVGDIGKYITDSIVTGLDAYAREKNGFIPPFKIEEVDLVVESEIFDATFKILNNSLNSDVFRRFHSDKNRYTGGFLISYFEVLALSIGHLRADETICTEEKIRNISKELHENDTFLKHSKPGSNARVRLPKLLELGLQLFKK